MLKGILTQLTSGHEKSEETNDTINIIGGFDPHVGNIREIKRILTEMGVSFNVLSDVSDVLDSPQTGEFQMYPGGTDLEVVKKIAPKAKATIALQTVSVRTTMADLKNAWNGETVSLYPMMSIRGMDKFLMEVSRITGKSVPASIEAERGRVVDAVTDAHQYIHGKRFAVFGDPDEVFGMVTFLLEMGGEPVHIITGWAPKKFEKELATLLESSPAGKNAKIYVGKDLWHMRSLLMTDPVDMLLGDSHGKYAARDAGIPHVRFGFPIFDRVNLHRYPIIGYPGVLNLVTWIVNAFIEETDRTSDNEHFELLR
jgi:nitrogenase molybdenum-iron protein beta chain